MRLQIPLSAAEYTTVDVTLIAGLLSAALGALIAAHVRRERANAAAGKHGRLSVGGLGAAYGVVIGSLGLAMVAVMVVVQGKALPVLPSLLLALMLWLSLTDRVESDVDEDGSRDARS
jgi:hypothetical protein